MDEANEGNLKTTPDVARRNKSVGAERRAAVKVEGPNSAAAVAAAACWNIMGGNSFGGARTQQRIAIHMCWRL